MAKKSKQEITTTFRFMCIREKNTSYHMDFSTLDEATQYIEELKDPKIEWYGLYKFTENSDLLKCITHKRLIPYKNLSINVLKAENSSEVPKKRKQSKKDI
jgi:hypothetical protein